MANKKRESEITAIAVYPDKPAIAIRIQNTLEAKQAFVGGYIQAVYPFDDPVALICNDEGKLLGLELNRALYDEQGNIYDVIAGLFLVCGVNGDEFVSLTPEQQEKYLAMYRHPQMFIQLNGKILAIPIEEE